jgi:hypothetical protein
MMDDDLNRLLDSGDAFERELLGSALKDAGSRVALERSLSALAAASPAALGGLGKASLLAMVAKWGAAGLLSGTVVAVGAGVLRTGSDSHAAARVEAATGAQPAASILQAPRETPRVKPDPAGAAGAPVAAAACEPYCPRSSARPAPSQVARETTVVSAPTGPSLAASGSLPTIRVAPASASLAPPPRGGRAATLAEEVRVLESARQALDRGASSDALVALDDYGRRFANGALRPEASLLRVEALLAAGRRDDAEALARRMLAHDPGGPHRAKLNRLLGQREESP